MGHRGGKFGLWKRETGTNLKPVDKGGSDADGFGG